MCVGMTPRQSVVALQPELHLRMDSTLPAPAAQIDQDAAVPILDHLVSRAAQLYSMPAVAAEVLQLTESGEVDRVALQACLENDPALTTRILKAVNSSLFGLTRKVTDLGQALSLLGVKPLKMLVLGFSIPSQLLAETEKEVLIEYWRHTLLKAAACRELSRYLFAARAEEAFTAGLLQDLGELVLIQQLGPSYIRFRRKVRKEQRPLREAEWLALGFDHVELSARLLKQWGMPAPFVAAIASKGQDPADGVEHDRILISVLHVAELMARIVQGGLEGTSAVAMVAHHELGLAEERLLGILQVLAQRAEELAKILSIDLPSSLDLSIAAHARLAEASAELLEQSSEQALLSEVAALQAQLQTAALHWKTPALSGPVKQQPAGNRTRTSEALPTREQLLLAGEQQLVEQVAAAIGRCRAQRRSFSLVLFRAHRASSEDEGDPSGYPAPRRLQAALSRWSNDCTGLILPQSSFALLWEGWKRNEGLELSRHILRQAQESSPLTAGAVLDAGWLLSAGLATLTLPSRNFPPHELIVAAQRCLAGAVLSGGGAVKSIEF